jgi:hypothetical protein
MEDDFNEYNDQDATDCANGDYNTWEENELAQDNEGGDFDYENDYPDGETEDQILDMMMEDRIGGTGCEDFGDCYYSE